MNTKIETLIAKYERQIAQGESMLPFASPDAPATLRDKEIIEEWKVILAALRAQADQQAQPVAWLYSEKGGKPLVSTIPPSCYEPNELSEHEVSVTPLFTSPPAQPQARELSDQEIDEAFSGVRNKRFMADFPIDKNWLDSIRAVIAADRAIRPAAGIVSVPVERLKVELSVADRHMQEICNANNMTEAQLAVKSANTWLHDKAYRKTSIDAAMIVAAKEPSNG